MKKLAFTFLLLLSLVGCTNQWSSISSVSSVPISSSTVISNTYILGNWYYYPSSNQGAMYEIQFEDNGEIVMVIGGADSGYTAFTGVYVLSNSEITYAVVSYDRIDLAMETVEDVFLAMANAPHRTGQYKMVSIDDDHFRLTGNFLNSEIDLTFTRGSYLQSIGKGLGNGWDK